MLDAIASKLDVECWTLSVGHFGAPAAALLRKLIALIFVTTACLSLANDAGINEGAYGPEPIDLEHDGESAVRMISETLQVRFGVEKAHVAIEYVFRNTSSSEIRQKIGFPDVGLALNRDSAIEDKFPNTGAPLEKLRMTVNGVDVPDVVQYGKIRISKSGIWLPPRSNEQALTMAWHTAEVDFPPGKSITINRTYTAIRGAYPYWHSVFMYFTLTGAQWQGTIGSMELMIQLTDGLTVSDLEWKPRGSNPYKVTVSPPRSEWQVLSPTSMRLAWKDFEPAKQKDRQWIRLVAPDKKATKAFWKTQEKENAEKR